MWSTRSCCMGQVIFSTCVTNGIDYPKHSGLHFVASNWLDTLIFFWVNCLVSLCYGNTVSDVKPGQSRRLISIKILEFQTSKKHSLHKNEAFPTFTNGYNSCNSVCFQYSHGLCSKWKPIHPQWLPSSQAASWWIC